MTSDKIWYAVYVRSRSEKKVALGLLINNIDYYLPVIKVLKQWSDRKKWIEEPLFKSYLFVNVNQDEFFKVIHTAGFLKYVSFAGKAVSIPDIQILAIKQFLEENNHENNVEANWITGKKVEIISGSLTGLIGELVELKGKHKVKIQIETVGSALLIEVPKSKLRVI
jgi:transcriptional antiterminator RfaH